MRTLVTIISLVALLQQSSPEDGQVDFQLQQMVAIVRNADGRLVHHLKPEDFTIEENGVPQTISHFSEDSDAPVSLGILIDISGSMSARSGGLSRLSAAEGAVRVLLRLMKPRDEFLLMAFSDGLSVKQKFTESPEILETELNKLSLAGGTNLFGAVSEALQKMRQAKYRKRALVVITDGIAGGDLKSLARDVRNAEVQIFTFGLGSKSALSVPPLNQGLQVSSAPLAIMNTLADESGGRSEWFDVADLDATLLRMVDFDRDIAADLRGQYTVSYYTKKPGAAIRLRVTDSRYTVQTRRNTLALGQ